MNYHARFTSGGWDPHDFMPVKSPRWQECSSWLQLDNCITNDIPPHIEKNINSGYDTTGDTYVSMLRKNPICGDARITTTCAFAKRMAPLLVLSKELLPVHHEHLEIVVFDMGINVWHHFFNDNKPSWKLIAFQDHALRADRQHRLITEIRFTSRGIFLYAGINHPTFGCRLPDDWPQTYYAGITACEGKNFFYDFAVSDIEENAHTVKRFPIQKKGANAK